MGKPEQSRRETRRKAIQDACVRGLLLLAALAGFVFAVATAMAGPILAGLPPERDVPVMGAGTGILEGKLTDTHSTPLTQAAVVVRNLSTGASARSITGKNGSYRFVNLGPGEYSLEASLPELGKGSVDGIMVTDGHATRVQAALRMEVPAPSELLEAGVHELDPVMPAVTTMLDSEELESLPISSRDWQGFEALTPQANPHPNGSAGNDSLGNAFGDETNGAMKGNGEEFSASAAGSGSALESSSIDGVASASAFHAPGPRSESRSAALGESAAESMQATTGNSPASDSPAAGSSINLVTSHGHNGFHGQAFYLNRQNLWAAQNPFTQWIQQSVPSSGIDIAQFTAEPYSPARSRQTIGLGVGSQIKRDKLYWFASLDGLLENHPAVATVRHPAEFFARPTDDELTVLAARLNLPGPAILEQAVSAYSGGLDQLASLLGPVPRRSTQWQSFGRVDWQVSERQSLSVDVDTAYEDAPAGALTRTSETYGSHSFGNQNGSEVWGSARLESFLTANLLNAAAVQYRWHTQSETPQKPSAFEQPLIANAWGQLPEMVADSTYGFILGKPARLGGSKDPTEQSYVAQDTLSWVRGAHLLKAGGSFDHIVDTVDTLVNQTGTYSYADVLNFVSDTASFEKYGFNDIGNPQSGEHNCDATGRVHTIQGVPSGLGYLPCYAWYSQRIGPSNWSLSTNDLAGFLTEQWQPWHNLTLSAGFRVQAEQLPNPILNIANPEIPDTQKFPSMALQYGPRIGFAWAPFESSSHSSGKGLVLRAGAGVYYGRIDNSTVLAALSQTGSPKGDLNFFFKPNDNGAPPFPYVFPVQPQTAVVPGAVSFAGNFHQQQVDQAVVSLEEELPSHWLISINAMASLGRHLPISIDTNIDTNSATGTAAKSDATQVPQTITYNVVDPLGAGPIKTAQVTVPFYTARLNPEYQQLASIESRANSTYDAAMVKIVRYGSHGFSMRAHYLYAHATDWNPNESGRVAESDVLDPADFNLEYGTSNLDIRHSAAFTLLYQTPWNLHHWAGDLVNGWSVAAVCQYRSGLPYTIRTSGYIPGYYEPLLSGGYQLTEGLAPGINGSGGDNRLYGFGRNTYRYPATYTGDTRIGKRFHFAHNRELELLAESFNLFNHQNVTLIETTGYTIDRGTATGGLPTLRFLSGLTTSGQPSLTTVEFGKPLDVNATNFYQPREFQFGLRTRF